MATSKTYYSHVAGCRFITKDGGEHFFVGGQLTTTDGDVHKELDAQISKGGNYLITDKPKGGTVDKEALAALVQVKEAAATAATAVLADNLTPEERLAKLRAVSSGNTTAPAV